MYGKCRQPARFLSVKAHEKSSFRVRNPIRSRTESDQIASAVRLDSVRCPIGLRTVAVGKGGDLRSKISSFIFELSHRKTSIHYPLALSLWDSSEL